jgi:hypothetical protein
LGGSSFQALGARGLGTVSKGAQDHGPAVGNFGGDDTAGQGTGVPSISSGRRR